jgi:hypothetical protein
MSRSPILRAAVREHTPFPELNAILAHFVAEARTILGETFIGAYLQGSFAIGDADRHSDCDFMVVIARDLEPEALSALQALHGAIHELPWEPWRHRLEGSYAPAAVLRRLSSEPRDPPGEPRPDDWGDPGRGGAPPRVYPFHYLDHSAKRLVRSEHDNSQVVRWSLREKGVVLAGPRSERSDRPRDTRCAPRCAPPWFWPWSWDWSPCT